MVFVVPSILKENYIFKSRYSISVVARGEMISFFIIKFDDLKLIYYDK